MPGEKTPFFEFLELGFTYVKGAISEAIEAYDRLRMRLFLYALAALGVTFLCWLINIYGEKQLIHIVIIAGIVASFYFLLLARNSVPLIAGVAIWVLGKQNLTPDKSWWGQLISTFFLLVSSITYIAIWPLLLLTWIDFSNRPSGFWQIYALCITLGLTDLQFSKEKRFAKYFFVAKPERLIHQLSVSALRLSIYSLGIF